MKRQHTPGPWLYQENADAYTHIVRAGDRYLCGFAQDTSGEAEANARLTAAGPDLLAALAGLEAEISSRFGRNPEETPDRMTEPLRTLVLSARAAISKAKGE